MTCQCGHAGGAHGYAIATVQFCALCDCKAFQPQESA